MIPLETMSSVVDGATTIGQMFKELDFLQIFAIFSGMLNAFYIIQQSRGKLISSKLYDEAITEVNRLRRKMDKERDMIWSKLLKYLSGLKATGSEGVDNNAPERDAS